MDSVNNDELTEYQFKNIVSLINLSFDKSGIQSISAD